MTLKTEQAFQPIIIQSGQNAYGMARSFYEAYGVRSLVLEPSRKKRNIQTFILGGSQAIATKNSRIVDFQQVDYLDDPNYFVHALTGVAKQYKNKKLLLFVCDCYYVELVIKNKQALENYFILPYIDESLMNQIQTKENFYKKCDLYNLKYPRTMVLTNKNYETTAISLAYPIIIKASNSAEYKNCSFLGKQKIFLVHNEEDQKRIVKSIFSSTYNDHLILQEYIPGDDTTIRVLYVYVGKDKKVKLMCLGNTLIEDPSPHHIGNSLAVVTDYDKQLMDKIRFFLEDIGYTGYANFDMKLDVRDGEYKLFEINLRTGTSSYYVTASGHNLMKYVVDDYVFGENLELTYVQAEHLWSLIPKKVLFKCIVNKPLKAEAKRLIKQGKYTDALYFKEDMNIKRWSMLKAYNLYLKIKFKKYYK
ncbi:ATP-grasp domain-containing protein [Lysinibacillus sp. NPDC096418]|uniref:carboxylate--amine ligase n=1 Tax=Lysinibacillus sp. NPDC096418 TaxID=3364138 RepID=UPI00380A2F50